MAMSSVCAARSHLTRRRSPGDDNWGKAASFQLLDDPCALYLGCDDTQQRDCRSDSNRTTPRDGVVVEFQQGVRAGRSQCEFVSLTYQHKLRCNQQMRALAQHSARHHQSLQRQLHALLGDSVVEPSEGATVTTENAG